MADILTMSFNQDNSCLAIGTNNGFRIYNCEPFGLCYEKEEQGGIGLIQMLFSTSLVAIVGTGEHPASSPRKLQLYNTSKNCIVFEQSFVSKILSMCLNRKRLIVILEEKLHIFEVSTMKLLHVIDTPINSKGVGSLSPSIDNNYLVCPSQHYHHNGDLLLFDVNSLQPMQIIAAHKNSIAIAAFNLNGSLLATASEKGTVIRVYSIPDCQCRFEFRRGTFPAKICGLFFNNNASFLCVTSDSETIHIFKLDSSIPAPNSSSKNPSIFASISGPLSDALKPQRDFAHLKISGSASLNESAINQESRSLQSFTYSIAALSNLDAQVLVACGSTRSFYCYAIDMEKGGECTLLRQHSLISPPKSSIIPSSNEEKTSNT